jgi:hypothetical protein
VFYTKTAPTSGVTCNFLKNHRRGCRNSLGSIPFSSCSARAPSPTRLVPNPIITQGHSLSHRLGQEIWERAKSKVNSWSKILIRPGLSALIFCVHNLWLSIRWTDLSFCYNTCINFSLVSSLGLSTLIQIARSWRIWVLLICCNV